MSLHHTKDKGDLGLVKAISDLTEKGFSVLTCLSEHLPFDFVCYNILNGALYKIQAKYIAAKNGRIELRLRSTTYNNTKGAYAKKTDYSKFDYYAIYCPQTNQCYYIPTSELSGESAFNLRLEPSKNGQTKGIHLASEYQNLLGA